MERGSLLSSTEATTMVVSKKICLMEKIVHFMLNNKTKLTREDSFKTSISLIASLLLNLALSGLKNMFIVEKWICFNHMV